ncbi:conserved protein, unknown function [Hepatocystis sp. ex Piliocolobus tephrosceles]|nr:conserved protein, unknown function [Hepatocystis sp. ex Piliocolobus tephrosceles]
MDNTNFANSSVNMSYFLNNSNVELEKNINMLNSNNNNNNNTNSPNTCASFLNNGVSQNSNNFNDMNKNDESIDILVSQMESSFCINTNIIENVNSLLESNELYDKIKGIQLVYGSLHYKYKNNPEYKKSLLNRGCIMLNVPDKNENNQTQLESSINTGISSNQNNYNSFYQNKYNNNSSSSNNNNDNNSGIFLNKNDNLNGLNHNNNNNDNNNNQNNCNNSTNNTTSSSNVATSNTNGSNNALMNNFNTGACSSSSSCSSNGITLQILNSMIYSTYKRLNDVDEYFELLDKCLTRENVIDINLSDVFEINIINMIKVLLYNYLYSNDEIIIESLTLLIIIFGCCGSTEKIKQDVLDELYTCVVYLLNNSCDKTGPKNCQKPLNPLIPQLIIALLRTILTYDIYKLKNDLIDRKGIVDALLEAIENTPNLNGVRVCYTIVVYGLKMFYISTSQMYEKSFLKELETITNYLSMCIKMSDEKILFLTSSTCITICENQVGIEFLLKTDILHNAVILCESSTADLAFEALSIISKIAYAANHQQICLLINCNVIKALKKILNNLKIKPGARARACNALGNIGCETASEVELLIKDDVFPLLVDIFETDNDFNTKIEAAYAVCACLSKANQKQVGYIISCTATTNKLGENICMQLIADMLELVSESDPMNSGSVKLCKSILRGLENILDKGDDETRDLSLWENPYVFMFKEVQGDIKLLQMQFFPEYYVVNKTYDILAKYFSLTSTWNNRK